MTKKLTLSLIVGAILAPTVFPVPAYAGHRWNGFHWARTTSSFTLKLGDNVSSAWDSYLADASSDWSASAALNTVIVRGSVSARKRCEPTSGRVEVCSGKYGNTGWLGIARIWARTSDSHIVKAIVKLNNTYFSRPQYDTSGWRRLVMCQEVAHAFGLDHQDETTSNGNLGTCMDYTNDPDGTLAGQASNEHPNQHDYDELAAIYAHPDSDTTVKQVFRGAASLREPSDGAVGTGQWGKLRRSTNSGRTELYELDLGRGHKILTHVIWAEPEEEEEEE
jgi:hypothetical protein